MNESVGNSLLLYLVVFFVGVVMLFYVGIISYSKAYRVKDNIIEIIEKNGVYRKDAVVKILDKDVAFSLTSEPEIDESLKQSGYSIVSASKLDSLCNSGSVLKHMRGILGSSATIENLHKVSQSGYNYCIFEVNNKSAFSDSSYYVVVTFVHFDFPVIGDRLNIPVYGETKVLGKNYDY